MATLTSDEALARGRLLDIQRYDLDLDLTRGSETFGCTTVVSFRAVEAGETFVELRPHTLHRAVLDGVELDPATLRDGRLPLTLAAGEHRLEVTADMSYSRTGEGMHRFTDPADGLTYLYTMCCMAEASLVYAAFDQPDLKAVFAVTVTAPEEWTVLANGVTTRVADEPGRWRSAPTPPLSTYLLAVAAGPWHSHRTEHAGLPFGLHVRQSLAPYLDRDAEELFDLTRRVFDRFHVLFDEPYPFDSYDQAFVPEFNHGAMENPGLVVFRDQFVNRSAATATERERRGVVIAHEMAHMWFGDLVTLRWWDDIWLNESFAEYLGYQVLTEATDYRPWTEFAASRKATGYDADQRPSTHPVAPVPGSVHDTAAAWLNFDGISYAKGASALRQLVAWLGESTFLAGLNEHFARHRFGNASLDDLIATLSHVSGRDVSAWADSWLRTSGPDTLTPEITQGDGVWHLDLHHTGGRPHRLRVGLYDTADGSGPAVLRDHPEVTLPADEATARHTYTGARPDLVVLNDGDLTYAKTPFDPESWEALRRSLGTLPEPLTRAVAWNTARTMVRDGALAPGAYLAAVRDQLAAETDTSVIEGVLGFARGTVADGYLTDAERDAALADLRAVTRHLLDHSTDPGLRLAAVRGHIDAASDPAHLTGWWREGAVPGGPELDPDLRWRVLHRLAVLGGTTAEEIDAEVARDTSATGQESAARCRAALPDPAHKEAAWDALFGSDRLSAYLFNATARGFWNPEQRELLAGYRDRYFDELPGLAARRGHTLTVSAAYHGFPRGFTDEDTLRLGQACLARTDLTPTLRRELVDQLDDLRRALAARGSAG